ncbi:hypothetical protein [Streptomyces sp. NPDC054849]
MSPTTPAAVDPEALRTVIEAAIVDYLGTAGLDAEKLDTGDFADHITGAVERLLATRPAADPATEGDEV